MKKFLCKIGFHEWEVTNTERILFTVGVTKVLRWLKCKECAKTELRTTTEKYLG